VSDPRWLVQAFFDWCKANEGKPGRWQRCLAALGTIATDPSLPTDQRAEAEEILDDFSAHAREHVAEALQALASLAEEPGEDGAAAQASLEAVLVELQTI
jgi:uncharacterized protein (UPF0147 family)